MQQYAINYIQKLTNSQIIPYEYIISLRTILTYFPYFEQQN
jgi:hypothetical protein